LLSNAEGHSARELHKLVAGSRAKTARDFSGSVVFFSFEFRDAAFADGVVPGRPGVVEGGPDKPKEEGTDVSLLAAPRFVRHGVDGSESGFHLLLDLVNMSRVRKIPVVSHSEELRVFVVIDGLVVDEELTGPVVLAVPVGKEKVFTFRLIDLHFVFIGP